MRLGPSSFNRVPIGPRIRPRLPRGALPTRLNEPNSLNTNERGVPCDGDETSRDRKRCGTRPTPAAVWNPLVLLVAVLAGGIKTPAAEPKPDALDSYNVVWETPSANYGGSMPLGNGDIGLNVWVEADGDLQFFISKTDAWDDNARLVKIGKVRVHLEPNPFAAGQPFRQTLSLRDATIVTEAGEGDRRAVVRVWVDANLPVIHVTADSQTPLEATAAIELWRTEQQPYTQLQTSDIMVNRRLPDGQQAPTIIEPDTVLADQAGRIGWYHHNIKSVGPQLLGEIQGLTEFRQPDPLLARTFGAIITAEQGQRLDDLHLRCPAAKSQRLNVFVLTQHPATPAEWLAEMDRTIARVEGDGLRRPPCGARAVVVRVLGPQLDSRGAAARRGNHGGRGGASQSASVAAGRRPERRQPLGRRVGRVSVFGRALNDPEIQTLAKLDRQAATSGQAGLLFSGSQLGPGGRFGRLGLDSRPDDRGLGPAGNTARRRSSNRGQDHAGRRGRIPARYLPRQQPAVHLRPNAAQSAGRRSRGPLDARGRGGRCGRRVPAVRGRPAGRRRRQRSDPRRSRLRQPDVPPAAVRDRLCRPRPLSDQVQRQHLHRAAARRQERPGLSPLGTRLLVAEHAAAVLRHDGRRRLRPDAAAVPHVRRRLARPVQVPHAKVLRPRRGVLPGVHLLLGRDLQRDLRLDAVGPAAGQAPGKRLAQVGMGRRAGTVLADAGLLRAHAGPRLPGTYAAAFRSRDPDVLRPALSDQRGGQAGDASFPGVGDLVGVHQPDARTGRLPGRDGAAAGLAAGRRRCRRA